MPRRYPSEFRRRVLDLVASGRTVAAIAENLDVSAQTIYTWRKQDQIDRGAVPGLSSTEHAELKAARQRIIELGNELAVTRCRRIACARPNEEFQIPEGKILRCRLGRVLPPTRLPHPGWSPRRWGWPSTTGDPVRPRRGLH